MGAMGVGAMGAMGVGAMSVGRGRGGGAGGWERGQAAEMWEKAR
jgi:hypothetical protein